jgi:hypothetical protein
LQKQEHKTYNEPPTIKNIRLCCCDILEVSFWIIWKVNLHKVGADNKNYTCNNAVKKIAFGKVFSVSLVSSASELESQNL